MMNVFIVIKKDTMPEIKINRKMKKETLIVKN